MIQEILDYLLIKSKFIIMSEEEIVNQIKDDEMLFIYCRVINNILNSDVFFQTSETLINKLDYFIYKKRFEKRYPNEIIVMFNEIADKIREYKTLEESEKIKLCALYINDEAKNRNLPFRKFPGYTLDLIYNDVKSDFVYANQILRCSNDQEIFNPFGFLGTMNLLANCYPSVFKESPDSLTLAYSASLVLEKDKNIFLSKMAKKTKKLLENIEEKLEIPNCMDKYEITAEKVKVKKD